MAPRRCADQERALRPPRQARQDDDLRPRQEAPGPCPCGRQAWLEESRHAGGDHRRGADRETEEGQERREGKGQEEDASAVGYLERNGTRFVLMLCDMTASSQSLALDPRVSLCCTEHTAPNSWMPRPSLGMTTE